MKLTKGDPLPSFSLVDQNGKEWKTKDHLGKGPLVIYFYPKDDTPGCTAEACSFRDEFEVFEEMGAQVVGISADSPESHLNFAKKHRLPFTLLSDEQKKVRQQFGVKGDLFGLLPGRETFVFSKEGKLIHRFNSQLNAKKHVSEAKKIIQRVK